MNNKLPPIKCLYYFKYKCFNDVGIVEVKRTDLPANTPKNKVYFWLHFSELNGKYDVSAMTFQAQGKTVQNKEYRILDDELYYITENNLELTGEESGLKYKRIDPSKIKDEALTAIKTFLGSLK